MKKFWGYVEKIKKGEAFPLLSQIMKKLLCLPQSSATVERLFSNINQMKSKVRKRLSTSTIKVTLHTKSEVDICYEFKPSDDYLKKFNKNMYDFKKPESDDSIEDWKRR